MLSRQSSRRVLAHDNRQLGLAGQVLADSSTLPHTRTERDHSQSPPVSRNRGSHSSASLNVDLALPTRLPHARSPMPGEESTLYSSFPPTSFAAAAAGAGSSSSNPTVAPSGSQADLGVHGTADFEAMKRSFEGAGRPAGPAGPVPPVNGVAGAPNAAPNPSGAPYQDVYGGAAPAAFPAPNGMYGAPYGGAPQPFIAGHQAQQASTSGATMLPAGAQNGAQVPANGTFSNATSPYLAAAGPNGAVPGAPPFAVANAPPQPGVAGGPTATPYAGSAFDQAPGSPNPYGGPTPAPGGGPAPFGSPVPGQFGGLGIGSPFMGMMSPMLGMGSPQLGGGNGFGMPYPIGGNQQQGIGGMGAGMTATQTPTVRRFVPPSLLAQSS